MKKSKHLIGSILISCAMAYSTLSFAYGPLYVPQLGEHLPANLGNFGSAQMKVDSLQAQGSGSNTAVILTLTPVVSDTPGAAGVTAPAEIIRQQTEISLANYVKKKTGQDREVKCTPPNTTDQSVICTILVPKN